MDEHEFIGIFLSQEVLDAEDTREHWPETFPRKPMLKRFVGHQDEILQPDYVGHGDQGVIFKFKRQGRDLCLKVV